MTRALHWQRPRRPGDAHDTGEALCGASSPTLVRSWDDVTCGTCKRGALKSMLLEHTAAGVEADFTPGAALPYDGPGATSLDARSQAIVERSKRGDDELRKGPRFRSVQHAVQTWAAYADEGASVKSGSTPERFKGMAQGTREGRVSNVERAVDDVVGVRAALDAAFDGGERWGDVVLSAELCRELYVMRIAGRPAWSSKRRECVQRHDADAEDAREMAASRSGCAVTLHQVSLVVRRGNREVRAALEASGELAAAPLFAPTAEREGPT